MATISSPRKEPKVSTFWRGGGKRRLEVVDVAEEGVGVERGGRDTEVEGGGGACWEDTRDEGGPPPTPWGEAVEARCRGDDSPPATTKNTRDPVNTVARALEIFNLIISVVKQDTDFLIVGGFWTPHIFSLFSLFFSFRLVSFFFLFFSLYFFFLFFFSCRFPPSSPFENHIGSLGRMRKMKLVLR